MARSCAQAEAFVASSRRTATAPALRIGWIVAALALLLGTTAGATRAQAAYPCSASTSGLILRSAGGMCASSLVPGQELDLTYRLTNVSIVDDPSGPFDGTLVAAVVDTGTTLITTLAQQGPDPGEVEFPGVLTFVPVCPIGSTGGSLAPGDPCDPLNDQCGSRQCGCVTSPVGVGCHRTADPNKVEVAMIANISFAPGQQRTLAKIRVKVTGSVPPPAACGLFYSRFDDGDFLTTADALCETQVSSGAQASADLSAPECQNDADCGDPQCNACVDVGINNHCEPRAANTACGADAAPGDCLLPGCAIDTDNVGVCQQNQNNAPQDTPCAPDDNVCTDDVCDANGVCQHIGLGGLPCDDLLFCTGTPSGDVCVAGNCEGPPIDCSDTIACTADTCSEDLKQCLHTPSDAACNDAIACTIDTCDVGQGCVSTPDDTRCDDGDPCTIDTCDATLGCVHEPDASCQCEDVCRRGPGYWATHSGTEKKNSIDVGALAIAQGGPLQVCGQVITSTSNALGSLSSDLEALCVKGEGERQRQLYRQLVTAALNCAISGCDCSKIIAGFDECNALCAGMNDGQVPHTVGIGRCMAALNCFNDGGRMIYGSCALGTCEGDKHTAAPDEIVCNPDDEEDQCGPGRKCEPFNHCDLPQTSAGSPNACNAARQNTCTIDSCD